MRSMILLQSFLSFTAIDLVHFPRHPVVDAHLLSGDRRLVYLLYLGRRLFLAPELRALLQVHDGVPSVVVHESTGLCLPV